jgi:hypothetical protein
LGRICYSPALPLLSPIFTWPISRPSLGPQSAHYLQLAHLRPLLAVHNPTGSPSSPSHCACTTSAHRPTPPRPRPASPSGQADIVRRTAPRDLPLKLFPFPSRLQKILGGFIPNCNRSVLTLFTNATKNHWAKDRIGDKVRTESLCCTPVASSYIYTPTGAPRSSKWTCHPRCDPLLLPHQCSTSHAD